MGLFELFTVLNTEVTRTDSPIKEMSAEFANYFIKQFRAVIHIGQECLTAC